ncbi:hypothetical protein Tco_1303003 [Tanacetum coccineum]
MFVVCACARFQVTPKTSHLHAVKRIFRYLKGQPKLGLWYPRDSPFDLEAFSDSDYARASLDRKSTTGGCQFLGKRLISSQCKKQTIIANSMTEVEYVPAANCCGQVLWIQNQMLDYGFNFMNTKIYIDNESTICIVKNPAWDLFKDHLCACPHHGFTELLQLDTFYNALTPTDQDSLNAATGGKLLAKTPRDALTIIENKSKVRNSRNKPIVSKVSMNAPSSSTPHSPEILMGKFWNTATSKTVNSVKQIHAIVDGKAVVISESSVRSDLLFNDEDGIACLTNDEIFENLALMGYEQLSTKLTFQKAKGQNFNFSKLIFDGMLRNLDPKRFLMYPRFLQLFLNNQLKDLPEPFNDTYETPTHSKKVFSNMARKSKKFSRKVTPLFDSMLVQNQAPEGEGSAIPPEPQPTPSTSQPNVSEPQTESLQTETPPTVSHELQTEAHIEQILPSPSTYQRKQRKTQKHRRAKKVTELPQTSVPLDHGADEAVHKEGVTGMDTGGSPRRQETMGGALAQTRSERVLEKPNEPPLPEGHTSGSGEGSMEHTFELMDTVPPTPHDSPLTGGYTPGSDEGRLKLKELMAICTKLSKQVLDLEKEKDAQAVEILKLKQRVKKLERKRKSSISHPRRRIYRQVESSDDDLDEEDASKQGRESDKTKSMFQDSDFDVLDDDMEDVEGETVHTATTGVSVVSAPVTTAGVAISTAEPRTPPTTAATAFIDEDLTIAQTLIKMKEEKAKEKGVAIKDVEDSPRPIRSITTLQPLPTIDPKDKELAHRLHEEELAELDRALKERQKQEEATSAALAEEFDEIQARIDVDHELAIRLTHEEQEKYTIEERARLLAKFFERRKKQLVAERAEAIRNKPPTKTQVRNRMITYLKHMGFHRRDQGLAQIESDAELAQRLHEEELAELDRAQKERQKQEEATSAALAEEFDEIQARIDADHELAVRLTHEEQEKYTIEERARLLAEFFEGRKKQLAAERAEAIRNKPPTRTQVRNRMITYHIHMGKYTHQQLKHKNFEEVQKLYEREKKWIDDFKPIDDDSQQQAESTKKRPRADSKEESSKKQKLEEDNDAEKEELRDNMDVVPRGDVAIDVESLATKYPIFDWKTHILNENMMYYQIIRADGSSKNYKIFSEMLDDFDRQDVIDLHRMVNERYETKIPEGYDLVHVLLMNTGVAIHMMIKKKYPLTQEMLSRMLNRRLEVDYESEMAFERLRFTRSQLQK